MKQIGIYNVAYMCLCRVPARKYQTYSFTDNTQTHNFIVKYVYDTFFKLQKY